MATTTATNQGSVPLIIEGPAYLLQFQNQLPGTENHKEFSVRTFKVLGSVQIVLGVVLVILSIVEIVRTYVLWLPFDLTCLVLSGWYIMTGFLPLCMSRKRERNLRRLRIGFMVCSIIGALIFAPTMLSLCFIGASVRARLGEEIVLYVCIAVLSFAEFVVSITGASYCCCCTPWKKTDQTRRVIYTAQPGQESTLSQSGIPVTVAQQNLLYTVGQSGNPVIVQYPGAQQYQFMATNTPMMAPTQYASTNQADTNSRPTIQVPVNHPTY